MSDNKEKRFGDTMKPFSSSNAKDKPSENLPKINKFHNYKCEFSDVLSFAVWTWKWFHDLTETLFFLIANFLVVYALQNLCLYVDENLF